MGAVVLDGPPLVRVSVGAVPDLDGSTIQVAIAKIHANSCVVSFASQSKLTAPIDLAEHLDLAGVLDLVPTLRAVVVACG